MQRPNIGLALRRLGYDFSLPAIGKRMAASGNTQANMHLAIIDYNLSFGDAGLPTFVLAFFLILVGCHADADKFKSVRYLRPPNRERGSCPAPTVTSLIEGQGGRTTVGGSSLREWAGGSGRAAGGGGFVSKLHDISSPRPQARWYQTRPASSLAA